MPVLLGVTVERCAHTHSVIERNSRWAGILSEKYPVALPEVGCSGYVWQRTGNDAVGWLIEELLEWLNGTITFVRSAVGWQVLWSRERRNDATWDATPYEALLRAVYALKEAESGHPTE